VLNLLGNAAKYTEEGAVVLSVGFDKGETDGEITLCISVRDTGIGIKPDDLAVLFDTFTRVDPAVTGNIEGAGLGLSISKELTRFMGGSISVESVYGEGSTFTVKLPQKIADNTPVSAAAERDNITLDKKEGCFIAPEAAVLVVDDNADNLKILRLLLSNTMIKVDTAIDGEKCLRAVAKKHYHAIIMDYMMPGQDGIETLRKLRETDGFNTPVIALTANVSTEAEEKLKSAGFAFCFPKPVVISELENALMKLIPSELTTPYIKAADKKAEANREAVRELANSGISYKDGLAFFSGDSAQYLKIARLFIENAERSKETIRNFAEKGDYSQLLYEVHSFKSRARAIGANALSDTAEKLENLCAVKDERYIKLLLPILFYEWDKADEGLKEFCGKDENNLAPTLETPAGRADFEKLLPLLKRNRQPDALELIEKYLAAKNTPETEDMLKKIRDKVNDIEFREAEELLINLIKEVSYEQSYSYS
jgi:CheY-like chemotaxis protein/anti-sigma regulatory factor (Ser/Thr protein kinase)